ncbi:MAG: endopeptidase La [Metamycoplasmataceae bacterium]
MNLPFIPSREIVGFETTPMTLEVGRKKSINSVNMSKILFSSKIVIVSQRDIDLATIKDKSDLYEYGTQCIITSAEPLPGGHLKLNLICEKRVRVIDINTSEINEEGLPFFSGDFEFDQIDENVSEKELEIYIDKIDTVISSISKGETLFPSKNISILKNSMGQKNFINSIASVIEFSFEDKYRIFSAKNILEQYKHFLTSLISYKNMLELDVDLDKDIKKNLDSQQREFLLRERMKVIRNKLGDEDETEDKVETILSSEDNKKIYPEEVLFAIKKEKSRLKNMMASSPEANISRTYIDLLTSLPWKKTNIESIDIKKAKRILEEHHFGLKDVKERIIEFLAVIINNKNQNPTTTKPYRLLSENNVEISEDIFTKANGYNKPTEQNSAPIITLLGPPGTGKTSLAQAIAESLDRKFIKISLGGIKDESEIRGHRRTYVGAMPGKIIQAIRKCGVSNPVILLDEIDKMSSDYKGDPSSAMLEVLDPEQNANFQDHYLEIEYDLSKVMFIATANYYENIPAALIDRVEIIELNSYTILEKVNIARKYLIGKVIKQNALKPEEFQITDVQLEHIIKHYTMEAGVRNLQRVLDKIARKIALGIVEGKIKDSFVIENKTITKFLGVIKFTDEDIDKEEQIGSVNGLAYTAYGGSTLPIEVTTFPGKGELKLTGQLKDVMQESAQIALAYIRSNAKDFDINFDFDENTIHIHVPEGAVPKDGPSAGVTFTTSIISALTRKPVSNLIGMTGEITLRGKVLAIGGLKEKSLAALRQGIKQIFIPKDNKRNLIDIPKEVTSEIKFIPVAHYLEIYNHIFKDTKSQQIISNLSAKKQKELNSSKCLI